MRLSLRVRKNALLFCAHLFAGGGMINELYLEILLKFFLLDNEAENIKSTLTIEYAVSRALPCGWQ